MTYTTVGAKPTSKRIYLTRHGQGEHNVDNNYDLRDATLTDLGREQCCQLSEKLKGDVQQKAQLIVCSPLRRTMETMLLSYPDLIKRLENEGKPPVLLDILQEAGDIPCDTPTYPLEALKHSQDGIFAHLDFSRLSSTYASKRGIFHPDSVSKRVQKVRQWLRTRDEQVIVVVAHGDILRYVVDGDPNKREWINCETKVFSFASDDLDDEQADMVEIEEQDSIKPKKATV